MSIRSPSRASAHACAVADCQKPVFFKRPYCIDHHRMYSASASGVVGSSTKRVRESRTPQPPSTPARTSTSLIALSPSPYQPAKRTHSTEADNTSSHDHVVGAEQHESALSFKRAREPMSAIPRTPTHPIRMSSAESPFSPPAKRSSNEGADDVPDASTAERLALERGRLLIELPARFFNSQLWSLSCPVCLIKKGPLELRACRKTATPEKCFDFEADSQPLAFLKSALAADGYDPASVIGAWKPVFQQFELRATCSGDAQRVAGSSKPGGRDNP